MGMDDYDLRICHCASRDCSKCPMRQTGTSGVLAEIAWRHGEWNHLNKCVEETENGVILHPTEEYNG